MEIFEGLRDSVSTLLSWMHPTQKCAYSFSNVAEHKLVESDTVRECICVTAILAAVEVLAALCFVGDGPDFMSGRCLISAPR